MTRFYRFLFSRSFVTAILAFICVSTALLLAFDKGELVPQLWVSVLALVLAYLAAFFTHERFRLDLFDQRFEIYRNTLQFCSTVLSLGGLERNERNKDQFDNAMQAAHDSFRGIGHHKTKALFGDDIVERFNKLNKSFAYITAYSGLAQNSDTFDIDIYFEHIEQVTNLVGELPDIFRPYLYFGDYRIH